MFYKLVVVILLLCADVLGDQSFPKTTISQGVLRGKYGKTRKCRTYSSFTGIPFAAPPIGRLRFKAPVPAEPWQGTFDASGLHPACPQSNPIVGNFSGFGNEDCLYLNVYSPQVVELLANSSNRLLPVIFYIHGGAFVLGSARPDWYGPEMFLDKDIVFVAPNYRLGALGFLSTGDELVPGNNGLKDQALALEWVKNNIAYFGGNPNRIASVGHSAGGACSHYHMLSPLTKDSIKAVIAQSGTANAFWAIAPSGEGVRHAKKLAQFLKCPTSSNRLMIDCLMEVDAADIIKQEPKFMDWGLDPIIPFKPVIEPNLKGAFLTDHPIKIIRSGRAAKVPFMTGITTEEGVLKSAAYYGNPTWIEDLNDDFNKVVPLTMQYDFQPNKDHLSRKLREFYFGNRSIDNTTKSELTKMYTDVYFMMWAEEAARLHYTNGPVYYYLFGYRGSESYSRIFGDPSYKYGVSHADELLYLFTLGKKFPNFVPSERDEHMIEILTTLWVNFASTGNPTPEDSAVVSIRWPPIATDSLEYLFINDVGKLEIAEKMYAERAEFLKDLGLHSRHEVKRSEL